MARDIIQQVGDLQPYTQFGGTTRQQNQVIYTNGICLAMTAEHSKHAFKILQIYELV